MLPNINNEMAISANTMFEILATHDWRGSIWELAVIFTGNIPSENRSKGVFEKNTPIGRATDLDIWREFFSRLQNSIDRINGEEK